MKGLTEDVVIDGVGVSLFGSLLRIMSTTAAKEARLAREMLIAWACRPPQAQILKTLLEGSNSSPRFDLS